MYRVIISSRSFNEKRNRGVFGEKEIELPFAPVPGTALLMDGYEFDLEDVCWDIACHKFRASMKDMIYPDDSAHADSLKQDADLLRGHGFTVREWDRKSD